MITLTQQDKHRQSPARQAGGELTEIEITPEMVGAGLECLRAEALFEEIVITRFEGAVVRKFLAAVFAQSKYRLVTLPRH